MQIELKRGKATKVTQLDKPAGAAECQLGTEPVWLHRDLADKVSEGDEVMLAGGMRDGRLHAMALKNLSRGKSGQIDGSNYGLLAGGGCFVGILCSVQAINATNIGEDGLAAMLALAALAGYAVIFFAVQRIFEINRAARQIKYA